MNVTKGRFNNRQLHMEDYLQMVSAEQREYAEVLDYQRIAENNHIITDFWTNSLLELNLRKDNLNKAYRRVKKNKGSGGIDGMQTNELLSYLIENQDTLIQQIRGGKYKPNPVRRVEIPKEEKGKVRNLGIPTVVDRMVQQAIAQELSPLFEEQFSDNSFGFRPKRGVVLQIIYGFMLHFIYNHFQDYPECHITLFKPDYAHKILLSKTKHIILTRMRLLTARTFGFSVMFD